MSQPEQPNAPLGLSEPIGIGRPKTFLPELESLRGISMLLVAVFHANSLLHFGAAGVPGIQVSPWAAYITEGYLGVDVFFFLSAFLLSLPMIARRPEQGQISLRAYFSRRALRILPLFWSVVIVSSFLHAEGPTDLLAVAPYLVFLEPFGLGTPIPPYSNVWWSLATEMQFYFLLPMLALCLRTSFGRFLGVVGVLAYMATYASWILGTIGIPSINGQLALAHSVFGRGPLFLCGIAAAAVYLRWGDSLRQTVGKNRFMAAGGADVMLLLLLGVLGSVQQWVVYIGIQQSNMVGNSWFHGVYGLLLVPIVLLFLLANMRTKPVFINRVMNRLGTLSYSAYMLHFPILWFGYPWLSKRLFVGSPLIGAGWTFETFCATVLLIGTCLALSEVTYRAIESPFLRLKGRIGVRRS